MSISISVSPHDIAHGRRRDSDFCPLALAAQRALPEYYLKVCSTYLFLIKSSAAGLNVRLFEHIILLPESARRFVSSFDSGETVKPLDFSIELPVENNHETHAV